MEEQNKITKSEENSPIVETFTGDMVQVIEDSQGGLIKKMIEEQEKKEFEKTNLSPQSKRNRLFVFVSLILILLAVSILAFIFFHTQNQTIAPMSLPTQTDQLIFTDQAKSLEVFGLDKDTIAQNVAAEVSQTDVKQGGIEAIYPTENGKNVGLRRFITLLHGSFVPGDFSLVSDNFLMGVVNKDANNSIQTTGAPQSSGLFILLKMRSFVDIFPAMRNWEGKMFSDLHALFGIDINATTTPLLNKSFEDGIIDNKNARVLYDDSGNIALMYVFADDQSLIIANNISAVNEVILRLASSQIKK